MRRRIVNIWANRDYPEWIYRRVATIVVALDVLHIHRAAHAWNLVNVLGIVEQIRVLP